MNESSKQISQIILRVERDRLIAKKSDEFASGLTREIASSLVGSKLDKTQVRGLENLANTTDKISEITDWLKIRIGRDGKGVHWSYKGTGHQLLAALENLRSEAKEITQVLKKYPFDSDFERQVHLQLCREFLKHLSTHFEYLKGSDKNAQLREFA
jgi:hypothetical protein